MSTSAIYHPFPNTHWSLVRRAGATTSSDPEARRQAMAVLLARYEPALKSYLKLVRRMGDEADDVLQAFVADKLLERDLLRHADEGRGKFRTFLLTSLNNFVTSRHRAKGPRGTERLEESSAEPPLAQLPRAEAQVDAAWARALVRNVVATMRDQCLNDGREDLWTVFELRVLKPLFDDAPPISYEELSHRLGGLSPTQVANLLVTAKRLYARLLRVAIAEYERDEANIDAEIMELRNSLAGAPWEER